jgi:hypothetical protein
MLPVSLFIVQFRIYKGPHSVGKDLQVPADRCLGSEWRDRRQPHDQNRREHELQISLSIIHGVSPGQWC